MKSYAYIACIIIMFLFTSCSSKTDEIVEDNAVETVETASEESELDLLEEEPWREAYLNYLETHLDSYDGYCSYSLIFLDDNDVPELLINGNVEATGELVLTYFDSEIIEYQLSRIGTVYIEKSGLMLCNNGHMDYYPLYIIELKDGKFSVLAEGLSYLEEENFELYLEVYDEAYTYVWNDSTVSKEEYNNNIASYFDVSKGQRPKQEYSLDEIYSLLNTKNISSYGHRYELVVQDLTWDEAQKLCQDKGGYLATITTVEEANNIARIIENENLTDTVFFVGYRANELVGNDYYPSRWINKDGTTTKTVHNQTSYFYAPDYEANGSEWRVEDGVTDCGIVKYYTETKMIYIFEGPEELLKVSPNYKGNMGFICEYD